MSLQKASKKIMKSRKNISIVLIILFMGVMMIFFTQPFGTGPTIHPPGATLNTPNNGDGYTHVSTTQKAKAKIGFYTRYSYDIPIEIKFYDSDGDLWQYTVSFNAQETGTDGFFVELGSEVVNPSKASTGFYDVTRTFTGRAWAPLVEGDPSPPTDREIQIRVHVEDIEGDVSGHRYDYTWTRTIKLGEDKSLPASGFTFISLSALIPVVIYVKKVKKRRGYV